MLRALDASSLWTRYAAQERARARELPWWAWLERREAAREAARFQRLADEARDEAEEAAAERIVGCCEVCGEPATAGPIPTAGWSRAAVRAVERPSIGRISKRVVDQFRGVDMATQIRLTCLRVKWANKYAGTIVHERCAESADLQHEPLAILDRIERAKIDLAVAGCCPECSSANVDELPAELGGPSAVCRDCGNAWNTGKAGA